MQPSSLNLTAQRDCVCTNELTVVTWLTWGWGCVRMLAVSILMWTVGASDGGAAVVWRCCWKPSLGRDACWMWLIVLLLLRTLFRLPPGPFRSIHCLFVLLLMNFTACAETYWEPKQLLYWWISLIRSRAAPGVMLFTGSTRILLNLFKKHLP